MRFLLLSILFSLSLILTSCGGGGGGGSSSNPQVKVAIDLDFEHGRAAEDGFYVSNTKINSVSLSYNNSVGSEGVLDVTDAVSSGMVEITDLIADTTYEFILVAISDENVQACTGSAEVTISPDVTNDADLTCVFIDTLAIENSVYEFATVLSSSTVTADAIDSFIAQDFGLFNGQTRDEFITDIVSDTGFVFTESGITLTKVDIQLVEEAAAVSESRLVARATDGSEADLYFYFSDGSVFSERVWVVKENDNWVLTGNDRNYEADIHFTSYYTIPSGDSGSSSGVIESFYSGLEVDFYDPSDLVESITLTGSTLGGDYFFEKYSGCTDCDSFDLISPTQANIPYVISYDFINLYDSASSTTASANPVFNMASANRDGTDDSETYSLTGSPVPLTELTEEHFITVSDTTSTDFVDYIGSSFEFVFQKPTAYDPVMLEYSLDISDGQGNYDFIEMRIPLTSSSYAVDFTQFTSFVPVSGTLEMTAADSEGRLYTTVVELYNSSQSSGGSSISATSMVNILNAFETLSSAELAGMITLMASSSGSPVQALLTAIADGSELGMTSTTIAETYYDALSRTNMYTPGSDEYIAYEAIVDAFVELIAVDSTGAEDIYTLFMSLSSTSLSAFVTVINSAEANGFNAFATFFSQDLATMISAIESATGQTVDFVDATSASLSSFMTATNIDVANYYATSAKVFSQDDYLVCSSVELAGADNALLYSKDGSSSYLYGFAHAVSNSSLKKCMNIHEVPDSSGSYNGYIYVTGYKTDYTPIINFIDDFGNLIWSKTYSTSGLTLMMLDTAIVGENVLMLLSDGSNMYIVEVNTNGAVVNNKKIAITDMSSGSYDATPSRLKVFPDVGMFVIVGSYIESSASTNEEPFLIPVSYTQGTSSITMGTLTGGYHVEFEDSGSTQIDAIFEDIELLAADKIALVGNAYSVYEGDLFISLLNLTTGNFYHYVYDNYSMYSDPASLNNLVYSGDTGALYMSTFLSTTGYTELFKFNFDASNALVVDSQASFYDAANDYYIENLYSDESGYISFVGDYAANEAAEVLVGAFSSADLAFDTSQVSTDQFAYTSVLRTQSYVYTYLNDTDNAIVIDIANSGIYMSDETSTATVTETDLTPGLD